MVYQPQISETVKEKTRCCGSAVCRCRAARATPTHKEMVSPYGGHTTCRRSSATKNLAKKATLMWRDTSLTKLISFLFTFMFYFGVFVYVIRGVAVWQIEEALKLILMKNVCWRFINNCRSSIIVNDQLHIVVWKRYVLNMYNYNLFYSLR